MPTNQNDFVGQTLSDDQLKSFAEKLKQQLGSERDPNPNEELQKASQLKSPDPNKVKQLRMFVDHLLIQSKNISSTREISLAYTNMQRGFMWLGKVLQGLDQPNPYPESTNVASSKIEERTDQAKDSPAMFEGFNFTDNDRTAAVKWFRDKLDGVISQIDFGYANRAADNAEDAFAEAKMWFGQELNNIRLASV